MPVTPYRQHSDFQLTYFVSGSCHTADGAYARLVSHRDDREAALLSAKSSLAREEAKIIRANRRLKSDDPADQLEAKAELFEIAAMKATHTKCILGAKNELEAINAEIARLQPYRAFAHLSDMEANEAMQRDEWRLELTRRAEDHILTSGNVPASEFTTMRMHPDFVTSILPAIEKARLSLENPEILREILNKKSTVLLENLNVTLLPG
jgi:hypothetical protein